MCFVWSFFAFCSFNHAPIAPIELFLPSHVRTMCCHSSTIHCQYFLHLTQYTIASCFCSVRTLLYAYSAIILAYLQRVGCHISKSVKTTAVVWQSVVTASGFRCPSAVLDTIPCAAAARVSAYQRTTLCAFCALWPCARLHAHGLSIKSIHPTFELQALTVYSRPCEPVGALFQRVRAPCRRAPRPCVRVLCIY